MSVLVPVLDGERYLGECLDSILGQTYPALEVVVLDDASTDSTPRIAQSYGGRVRYRRQPNTLGIYANVNAGLAEARGTYVAVYHADDVYHPTIVAREVAWLERFPEAGAVFCADILVDADGREYGRLELPPEVRGGRPLPYPVVLNALLTYKNRFLRCPSSMLRASVYREVGPYRPERFHNTADLEMWLRVARRYGIGILEDHLFRYRHHPRSSARRYHYLRTEPDRHFEILDLYLADDGHAHATREALAAHEAHRAEDWLMIAVRQYIRGHVEPARDALDRVTVAALLASARVQRGRLLGLWLILRVLTRLPHIRWIGDAFHRHWYPKSGAGAVPASAVRGIAPSRTGFRARQP